VHGDFSRLLDPGPHSGVLAQQGRLLLDADLNEQTAIVLDYLRGLATDVLGPFAAPAGGHGFHVTLVLDDSEAKCRGVRLGAGHYYVYGLRCQTAAEEIELAERAAPFVVYLVVWEQTVRVEADPALGPIVTDTALRTQVRWRVVAAKHLPDSDDELAELPEHDLRHAFDAHNRDTRGRPRLAARAHSRTPAGETPTAADYRGAENQLYRVEVHTGGDAEHATFKWSRDNGSVEFAVEGLTVDEQGTVVATLHGGWRDARRGLEVGDWVELVDDEWAPIGSPRPLLRVHGITLARREIELRSAAVFTPEHRLHPRLRRWDQRPDESADDHAIPVERAEGAWFALEDGIQIYFEPRDARYERGDYWLIPARTATRGVLWPCVGGHEPGPLALPPHGPLRYRAPLARVKSLKEPKDLRPIIRPIAGEPAPVAEADPLEATAIVTPRAVFVLRSIAVFAHGTVFELHEGTLTLGRADTVDIQLAHADVSRRQAEITHNGEELYIVDPGSSNGPFLNGKRMELETPYPLAADDGIRFHDEVQLRVERRE
jgi:hypothetical protein